MRRKNIVILVLIILFTSSIITFADIDNIESIEEIIEEDKEIEKENLIKIIFKLDGGSFIGDYEEELEYSRDEVLDLSKYKLEKNKYEFIGWSLSDDGKILEKLNLKDYKEKEFIILYPLFEKKEIEEKITINLNYYEDKVEKKEITLKEINEILEKEPERSGYEFLYWSLEESGDEIKELREEDIPDSKVLDIYGVWIKIEETEFKVKFNSNGGTEIESQIVKKGNTLSEVKTPIKTGYEFVSWQLDNEDFNLTEKINKNLELVAKWNKKINFKTLKEFNGVDEDLGKKGIFLEIDNNLLEKKEQNIWVIIKILDEKGRAIHLTQVEKNLEGKENWSLKVFYSNLPKEKITYRVYVWDGKESQNILQRTPKEIVVNYSQEVSY